VITGRDHKYGFGGKEYNDELGLDWYDVSARNYSPDIARWMNLDPLAEKMRRHSPYNFGFDNPVFFQDYDGMMPTGGTDPIKKAKAIGRKVDAAVVGGIDTALRGTADAIYNGAKALDAMMGGYFFTHKDGGGEQPTVGADKNKIDAAPGEPALTMADADTKKLKKGTKVGDGKTNGTFTSEAAKFVKGLVDKFTGGAGDADKMIKKGEKLAQQIGTMNAENTASEPESTGESITFTNVTGVTPRLANNYSQVRTVEIDSTVQPKDVSSVLAKKAAILNRANEQRDSNNR